MKIAFTLVQAVLIWGTGVCALFALSLPDWLHTVPATDLLFDVGMWQITKGCDIEPSEACGDFDGTESTIDYCDDNPDSSLCGSTADAARAFSVLGFVFAILLACLHLADVFRNIKKPVQQFWCAVASSVSLFLSLMLFTSQNLCANLDNDGNFEECLYGAGYFFATLGMVTG
eukprot:CAMPEP_0182483296 /NCGR_PEP_ID=MMETSP1319-20130603/41043_1 /TAXON_ID=172717 /ORGANISM="Bolidomonas pacifica, Strain RCC208" /LENGTH=172 /DNA_ID=CAMNT_0024685091 /DNA_START=9 /DNA_END=524 /DNA_ORIENTATION=-